MRLLLVLAVSVGEEAIIGREFGLSEETESVDQTHAQWVLRGAELGNLDSLHFSALLHLYGKGGVRRDAVKAASLFRTAAERGHASAQSALGTLLRLGSGVSRDAHAAFAWFAASARESGHVEAAWQLGLMHLEGSGPTPADATLARFWLEKASERESPEAKHWLGVMEEYGLSREAAPRRTRPANLTAAADWYRRAAALGHPASVFHLGLMHAFGRGLQQDHARALILFRTAAQRRHAGAMYYVGLSALYGHGVPVDYQMARVWFQRASATNDAAFADQAASALQELEASLSAAEDVQRARLEKYAEASYAEPPRR